MADEPDEVGQEDEECESDAGPEPAALEIAARGSEDEAGEDAGDVEDDGVLGFEAEAERSADGEPPARVFGLEEPNDEVSDENPPEEIERSVLELVAFKERKRGESDGEGRGDLRQSRAAEFAGHEPAENDDDRLRDDRGEAETDDGDAEESEADVLHEWSEGRVSDESPVEVARVGEELQLVAMKAVAVVGEEMKERDGGGDGEEDGGIGCERGTRVGWSAERLGTNHPPDGLLGEVYAEEQAAVPLLLSRG